MCLMGNMELLRKQRRGIVPHHAVRGKSHGFSRVVVEPGVHSRVTAGMAIQNSFVQ